MVAPVFTKARNPSVTAERLRRYCGANGRLPALMASPPTISGPTDNATTIASGRTRLPSDADAPFTYTGAFWQPTGLGAPFDAFYYPKVVTYGPETSILNTDPPTAGSNARVRFMFAGLALEVLNKVFTAGFRLKVDGDYAHTGSKASLAAGTLTLFTKYVFPDRTPRLIEIEWDAGNIWFGGIRHGLLDSAWSHYDERDQFIFDCFGNSFVEGTGAAASGLRGGFVGQLAALLGITNMAGMGVGATGWLKSTATRFKAGQHLSDITARNPHAVLTEFGVNDTAGYVTGGYALTSEIQADLDIVEAGLNNAILFVMGPPVRFASNDGGLDPVFGNVRDAIQKACTGRARTVFIDPISENWVTGGGYVGNTNGLGPADVLVSADSTHWSDLGHTVGAFRLRRAIMRGVDALYPQT